MFSQSVKEKVPAFFGLQYKVVLPGDFIAPSSITLENQSLITQFKLSSAFSFGAITRIGISKLLSLETGINQVKRKYIIDFQHIDSSLTGNSKLSVINYDIPINWMVYVPLSKQFFMNASLGVSFVFFPSNVATLDTTQFGRFIAEGRRLSHFGGTLNANMGFEFRSKKLGFFYIGCSGIIPFKNIYKVASAYVYVNQTQYLSTGYLNGAYLSIDLRYYLPNIAKKGGGLPDGPIK